MHLTHNPSPITRNPAAEKHAFSAKERDVETGLSYFGARYYSSDLSLWLSVDPMSGKYPHQSNYVYCSNNPLQVIDPNGEDEWDLARDGTLTKRGNGRTDVDIAIDFFEFAAENTEVEWALNIGKKETIVGTSHQSVFNNVRSPKNVLYQIHSHWNNSHGLSSRGANGEPCPSCDIPMMIKSPYTFKVYEAFNHRYVSMDDHKNYRYEISKNILKSANLLKRMIQLWSR